MWQCNYQPQLFRTCDEKNNYTVLVVEETINNGVKIKEHESGLDLYMGDGVTVATTDDGNTVTAVSTQPATQFVQELQFLAQKFGAENVSEALEVLKLNTKNINERNFVLENVERYSKALQKINSNERWKTFKRDPNTGITMGSIEEAEAAIACEEQGLIKGTLKRSAHEGQDFIDQDGNKWDVKTPKSYAYNGKYIFNLKETISSLKKGHGEGENIILQITDLNDKDQQTLLANLRQQLNNNEMFRTIIVHVNDASKSTRLSKKGS